MREAYSRLETASEASFAKRKVSEIIDVQPRTHRIKTSEYLKRGCIPVIDQGTTRIAGYINDAHRAYGGPLPVVVFGDHTCSFKFATSNFAVGADGTQLLTGKSGVDTKYLYYALQTAPVEQFGYQRHFKLLKQSEISVPSLPMQRRIASILGTYDDLIDVNQRRIALLEKMSSRLFEEWFVRFRFPGHESHQIVETPDGQLPEGWRRTTIGEAAQNFDRFRKPLSKMARQKMPGTYPYYGAAKIFDYIDRYLFEGLHLLVAEDGSVVTDEGYPVLQLVSGQFWVNNHAHVLRGFETVSTEFLYLTLQQYPIRGHITGAAQPKITQENLNRIPLVVASSAIMQHFNSIAKSLIELRLALEAANERLATTRDLILPRLTLGELSISMAERELEAVA